MSWWLGQVAFELLSMKNIVMSAEIVFVTCNHTRKACWAASPKPLWRSKVEMVILETLHVPFHWTTGFHKLTDL